MLNRQAACIARWTWDGLEHLLCIGGLDLTRWMIPLLQAVEGGGPSALAGVGGSRRSKATTCGLRGGGIPDKNGLAKTLLPFAMMAKKKFPQIKRSGEGNATSLSRSQKNAPDVAKIVLSIKLPPPP